MVYDRGAAAVARTPAVTNAIIDVLAGVRMYRCSQPPSASGAPSVSATGADELRTRDLA
jgi:hypothetical protein